MRVWGEQAISAVAQEGLTRHWQEREELLHRITQALQSDKRVVAAWLLGSLGRGDADYLSDIDLCLVVKDADFEIAVGSADARHAFVLQTAGSILLMSEAPQNAPTGGAYTSSLSSGAFGPHRVDWYWQRRSQAVLPTEVICLLFDRIGLPSVPAMSDQKFPSLPAETAQEKAVRDCAGFWGMLLIAAKYVAQSPTEAGMGLLKWAYLSLHELERFLGQETSVKTDISGITGPRVKIEVLRQLMEHGKSLTPLLEERGIQIPNNEIAAQTALYLDLILGAASYDGSRN